MLFSSFGKRNVRIPFERLRQMHVSLFHISVQVSHFKVPVTVTRHDDFNNLTCVHFMFFSLVFT